MRPSRLGFGRRGDRRYSCSLGTRGFSQRRDSFGFLADPEPEGDIDPALDKLTPCLAS